MYEEAWIPSKIFKDESKLQPEYIPKRLLHRDEQMKALEEYFRPFLQKPGSIFVRVVFVGPSGTGKTAVARKFGERVNGLRARDGSVIRFAYVNCHANRTLFSIMQKVGRDLGLDVPRRGYSREELIYMIWNHLKGAREYLIAAIDEVDYLAGVEGGEALYVLTRLPEITGDTVFRVGLIFVFRELGSFFRLDRSIQSTLQHNVIKFEPYTRAQLADILWARVVEEGAIYESAVSDEVIDMIAELIGYDTGGRGDARQALEVLEKAGKIAEREGRSVILPEDVREAYSKVMPISRDVIANLKLDEKLLLLALARLLQRKRFVSKVPIGLLELEYQEVCEEFGVEPKRHTAVWDYVRNLHRMGIVTAERSGKGQKGRTTFVGLSAIPLQELERELILMIRRALKRGGGRSE
jgi:cell division control protein 6